MDKFLSPLFWSNFEWWSQKLLQYLTNWLVVVPKPKFLTVFSKTILDGEANTYPSFFSEHTNSERMVLSTSSITSYTSLVTHIIGSSIKHTNNTNIAPGHHTTLSSTTPAWWSSSTQGQSTRAVPIIHHMYRCTCYSFRHSTITRDIRYTAVNNMWINDFTYSVRMNTARIIR